ncbi:MAG TPA: NADP-dependent oxidoreductase [Quisquiliibacterium sp.]|nr:NADP-dependent oxidoreductase [Quisquiliibacterium sp.]
MNRQWIYARRPEGAVTTDIFELQLTDLPQPAPGEALVRVKIISVDPANRAWMQGRTYRPQLQPGEVMGGFGLGEVIASNTPQLRPGDLVDGDFGWRDYLTVRPDQVTKRDPRHAPEHLVGVLGITGLTAYFGLFDVGRPVAGETVMVSAAAGAVGSVAGQLARIAGCRVIGVTGGQAKCDWITGTLGFDAALDYKAGDLKAALKEICPEGVDVYFDNTGGAPLDAALARMNVGGRIACCGNVSQYDRGGAAGGPPGVPGLLVTKRIRMEGFIVTDHFARRHQAERALAGWLRDGRLKAPMDIVEGFERVPQALVDLLHGRNRGKMMIRIA